MFNIQQCRKPVLSCSKKKQTYTQQTKDLQKHQQCGGSKLRSVFERTLSSKILTGLKSVNLDFFESLSSGFVRFRSRDRERFFERDLLRDRERLRERDLEKKPKIFELQKNKLVQLKLSCQGAMT